MTAHWDGSRMRAIYDRVIREPVPERFRELLRKLEEPVQSEPSSPGEANADETLPAQPDARQETKPK